LIRRSGRSALYAENDYVGLQSLAEQGGPAVHDIEIRDVLTLARSEVTDAPGELKQLYLWRYDYLSTAAKAFVGAGGSLLVALVAATIQHKDGTPWLPIVYGYIGATLVLVFGIARYVRIRRIYREYLTAQSLLGEALAVKAFLRVYDPEA
jgi:hypothetical protein